MCISLSARSMAATILALALIAPLPASAGIFLQLGDLKGEATDDNYRDWIEILSVSESLTNSTSVSIGGGGGAGKVQFGSLNLVKLLDLSSVDLRSNLAAGNHFDEAVIDVTRSGSGPGSRESAFYFRLELKNVVISSISLSADGISTPVENVSLEFGEVKWIYQPQDSTGKPGSPVEAGWNVVNNKAQ